jgi:hypothetical protein
MEKVKLMSTVEKACQSYVLWTSITMILFAIYYYQYLFTQYDIVSVTTDTFPKVKQVLYSMMGGFFFFGVFNIIICGICGVGMIFTKGTRKIGIVAFIAAISFYSILRHIGDAL